MKADFLFRGRFQLSRELYAVLAATAVLGLLFGVAISFYLLNRPTGARPTTIVIPPGATVAQMARTLEDAGVIRSSRFFRILSVAGSVSTELTAGPHPVHGWMTTWEVLQELRIPRDETVKVTLPEGLRKEAVFAVLAEAMDLDPGVLDSLSSDRAFCRKRGIKVGDLEGYLFPETYLVSKYATESQVLNLLVEHFDAAYDDEIANRARRIGFTRHEVVTMASIIEGEARLGEERTTISAVYHNRLKKRMRLQADPTVQYALPDGPRRLFYKDYTFHSSYNTYLHAGLPPGPIGSPGKASLSAAVNPAAVDYLYFVAKGDGSHVFSRTSKEHEAAKRMTRATRRQTWKKSKVP